ncbi:MAG: LPS export ABC transporter permease LptG [Gammaproteobacteria bacterium]
MLDLYVVRNFLSGAAIVLFLLLTLFGFLMLAEELEDVGKGVFTSFDAVTVVTYSFPKIMLDLLPVTALMGVLIGLGAMANHRELIVLRAVGLATSRIARPVVRVIFAVIAFVLVLQFFVIPQLELEAARIRSKTTPQTTVSSSGGEFWTRSGARLIHVSQVSQHGELGNVEIFDVGEAGQLRELVQASRVELLGDGKWLLSDVVLTDLRSPEISEERAESQMWRSFLTAEQTSALIVPVEAMSPPALYQYIRLLDKNGLDTHRYRIIFWQQLSIPIGLLAMALLGFPFLMGSVRSTSAGQRVAIGGSIGILFYLSEQMIGNLAVLFELNPVLAATAPDVSLMAIALISLRRIG